MTTKAEREAWTRRSLDAQYEVIRSSVAKRVFAVADTLPPGERAALLRAFDPAEMTTMRDLPSWMRKLLRRRS